MRVPTDVVVPVLLSVLVWPGGANAQEIFSSDFEIGTTCDWTATVPTLVEEEAPPANPSWWCDGIDNDCDGDIDETSWATLRLYNVVPTVVYRQAKTPVTLYVSNNFGDVAKVWVEEEGTGSVTEISSSDWYWTGDQPHVVVASIPAGLTAGAYGVGVEDAAGCGSRLDSALFIEGSSTLTVNAIEPTFAEDDRMRRVEIAGAGFVELPDIYLSPAVGEAVPLASASFIDSGAITAIVPGGLAAGQYDVVVVNPDGSVGVGAGLLEVSALAGPTITAVSPPRVTAGLTGSVHIDGADFRTPTVEFFCLDLAGTTETHLAGVGTSSTTTEIDTSLPATALSAGDKCVVRVTNDDGTYAEYSLLSITTPAGTTYSINAGPAMNVARRAPAVVAGRATSSDRFLYAVGGDTGDPNSPLDTIEAAAIDSFGRLGSWSFLRGALPGPRTLADVVRVGRFLYLVAGHDGTGPVGPVLRAEVLDPNGAPVPETVFIDLNIDSLGQVIGGLPPGTYSYRCSAWFDPNDPDTPEGESLAGPPVVVRVPTINAGDPDNNNGVWVTPVWEGVPGAAAYRIYRSPVADSGSGSEEFLDVVVTAPGAEQILYFDDNSTVVGEGTPLPLGSLSAWRGSTWITPRAGACVAAGSNPDPNDPEVYLYVAGGMGEDRGLLSSIDIIPVDPESGEAGPQVASTASLTKARWLCDATTVDRELHPVACDEGGCTSWIYFGSGEGASGLTDDFDAGEVGSDGDLVSWTTAVGSVGAGGRAGYALGSADDRLYVFGGQSGVAMSAGGREGDLDTSDMPHLVSFNSLGGLTMAVPRFLPGTATESGYFFVVGGQTDTDEPPTITNTVDVVPF